MGDCIVCLETQGSGGFICPTENCTYQMCTDCVKLAFDDPSGKNYDTCPMCHVPTSRVMFESLCGKGPVRAVERELRSKVEFEVTRDSLKKDQGKVNMAEFKGKAMSLFRDLCEQLNMKCPRCAMVFDDYDGCNALTCGNSKCRAAFCAVCLKDCHDNVHAHVARDHGNVFDKSAFEKAKKNREAVTVAAFMESIQDEPFEVKELIKVNYEKCFPEHAGSKPANKDDANWFLEKAKQSLVVALCNDRLSILNNPEQLRFGPGDLSPRNSIPEDYKLSLVSRDRESICGITLHRRDLIEPTGWRVIPLPTDSKENPDDDCAIVDSLVNIRGAILCGVIAFRGARHLYQSKAVPAAKQLADNEVSVQFQRIGKNGNLNDEVETLDSIIRNATHDDEIAILGINQNLRLVLLERHISDSHPDVLLFDPLRHFVGCGQPRRVFADINNPAPDTFHELNEQQQRVAHPLSLMTAMDVAGPPGSGKTKTITELVRAILECTDHDVIVLSERNGAIDAIADKFADDCLTRRSDKVKRITDIALWMSLMSFGASGAMGSSTKLFTLDEKIKYHPELLELYRVLEEKQAENKKIRVQMLSLLSKAIDDFDSILPQGSNAWKRSRLIQNCDDYELSTPTNILQTLSNAHQAIVIADKAKAGGDESNIDDIVIDFSSILGGLFPVRSDKEKRDHKWASYKTDVHSALRHITGSFETLLESDAFSLTKIEAAQLAVRKPQQDFMEAKRRIEQDLRSCPRVHLSTIGSSHKLPVVNKAGDDNDRLTESFAAIKRHDGPQEKRTVVIFDEAGCIPMYEFLGLSRLGRIIVCLVCVGDKNQLPPYDPGCSRTIDRHVGGSRQGGRHQTFRPNVSAGTIKSLLDASQLTLDGKIKLTTQYRVPRDIANLLDARIYKGDYVTPLSCKVPLNGFHFVHVTVCQRRKKYVNENEIRLCLELAENSLREGSDSIMVLTPYKKQQRELQFVFRREGPKFKAIPILTIDQCQGQEADIVILSLVHKPTRFLTRNRLNVALSRVRQKLFFLVDKREFVSASMNSSWECSLLAKDLLQLDGGYTARNFF